MNCQLFLFFKGGYLRTGVERRMFTLTSFYGSRKITEQLRRDEHIFMAWSMPHFLKNGGPVSRFLAILRTWVVRTVKPTKQTVRKIRTARTP